MASDGKAISNLMAMSLEELRNVLAPQAAPSVPEITPQLRGGAVEASHAQRAMLFLDETGQLDDCAYNACTAYHVNGPLDVQAVRAAFEELVVRHEALRTVFQRDADRLLQVIRTDAQYDFSVTDGDGPADVEAQLEAFCSLRFDLKLGPVVRCLVIRVSDQQFVVAVAAHHVAADGWSMALLEGQFSENYNLLVRDEEPTREPERLQYADYSIWQEGFLREGGAVAGMRHQADRLKSFLDRPALPHTGALGGCDPRGRPRSIILLVQPELRKQLLELAANRRISPHVVFLTAFAISIHRMTATRRFLLTTPVHNRVRRGSSAIVGPMANLVLLPFDFSEDPTLDELLDQAWREHVAALVDQEIPFEALVQLMEPRREKGQSRLNHTMFVHQNLSEGGLGLDGCSVRRMLLRPPVTKCDLLLEIGSEDEGDFICRFEYPQGLFGDDSIASLAYLFCSSLSSLLVNPALRAGAVPLRPASLPAVWIE